LLFILYNVDYILDCLQCFTW